LHHHHGNRPLPQTAKRGNAKRGFAPPMAIRIGAALKTARTLRGVTILTLARSIGVSERQVGRYEDGDVNAEALLRIGRALGLSLDDLGRQLLGDELRGPEVPTPLFDPDAVDLAATAASLSPMARRHLRRFLRALAPVDGRSRPRLRSSK
jgi:transcriptional regulator with XRE-family HTH domain